MKHRALVFCLVSALVWLSLSSGTACAAECPSDEPGDDGDSGTAASTDPNELTGPVGYGAKHYIPLGTIHPYRIAFENDAAATAPAQQVDISNQLDHNLNRSTFQITEIGFGDTFIPVPPGSTVYETVTSMTYMDVTFDVHIKAGIDESSGEVYAHFYSIDAETGLPPAVNIGFLPPEDGTGRGMGHIGYIINHGQNVAEGTEIRNIARIVFDMGEVIYTNQVDPHNPSQGTDPEKEALVTIDSARPSSAIVHIENITDTTYNILWGGYDSGSGIAGYTVYVRDGDQLDWQTWLENTQETSAEFTGTPGHNYEFYITGTDNVGYQTIKDIVPEAKLSIPGLLDGDLDGIADSDDNCPSVANADQMDTDGDGKGDACDNDDDGDGIPADQDNCPSIANAGQEDSDGDGLGDVCDDDADNDGIADASDNCPFTSNANQADLDGDGLGDACDDDADGDGITGSGDNCPMIANADQADLDSDGFGDICDEDDDGDGIVDINDNCPLIANGDQADRDGDGLGDACDDDDDGDGIADSSDNCPIISNADQADLDGDGLGDLCDDDDDGDGIADSSDNCPIISNADQADLDGDGLGDLCDDDDDGDGIADTDDNCPMASNSDQADLDGDGIGDVCDICPADADNDIDTDGLCGDADNCPAIANPGQADLDRDGLGDPCDPQTCGNNILEPAEFCDDGNFTDGDDCSANCITEIAISITKAEIEWSKELIKYKGTIVLPLGVLPVHIVPQSDISIEIADLAPITAEGINFSVKANEDKKWDFKSEGPLQKFNIDWKGEIFDYKGAVHIKANHIGRQTTTIEIDREGYAGQFSLQFGSIVIQVGADNTVVTTPSTLPIDITDSDGEIEVDLPFTLTPDMVMVLTQPNQADTAVTVGDHFTHSTGKFDIEAHFDSQGRTGLDVPATAQLRIALGRIGYPGYSLINSGWKSIKANEWKYE